MQDTRTSWQLSRAHCRSVESPVSERLCLSAWEGYSGLVERDL
jgi:hypothetical protein